MSIGLRAILPPSATRDAALLVAAEGYTAVADGCVSVLLPAYLLLLGSGALQIGLLTTRHAVGVCAADARWSARGAWMGLPTLLLAASVVVAAISHPYPPEATRHHHLRQEPDAVVTPAERAHGSLPNPADEIATSGGFERQVAHSAASRANATQRKWQPIKPQGLCAGRADPGPRARTEVRVCGEFSILSID